MFVFILPILLLIACFISMLCKRKSLVLSVGIIFLIELVWEIISCAYLDFGNVYIIETALTSHYTGALIRMVILYLPLILIILSKKSGELNKAYQNKFYTKKINCDSCIRAILVFTLLVVFYCILDMFVSGIPLFSSEITRINYSKYSRLPFATKMNGEITFFGMIIAGVAYFNKSNKFNKKIAITLFLISIVYRLLMEYKYHGMYNIIFSFFLPGLIMYYKKKDYKLFSLKNILKIITISFAVICLCLFIYSNTNKNFDAKKLLFDRVFALQSHTFWTLDEKMWASKKFSGDKNELKSEVYAIINNLGELDTNSGIIRVMYEISNKSTVDANLANGVRWAGSYLTVGINTIGYLGTIMISCALGLLILFDIKMFYTSMNNNEFFILYFAQSFMWDLLDYFRIGNWCLLINAKTLITFVVLLIIYLLKKRNEGLVISNG